MDLLRRLKLNSITKKLGSIVISDDRIDCYVDNNKLRKYLEKKKNYLNLDSTQKKSDYGIDKPITYHISDYCFDGIVISTTDSIHFSNCTFNDEVTIAKADQIVLENNNYINSSNSFKYNDRFLIGTNIQEFIMLNDSYENEREDCKVDMKIKAESIRFSNSNVLNGVGAKCEFLNISFAGKGQNLDTGIKVIHNAPRTSTVVNAKSISKDGGVCTFRSNALVKKNASHSQLSLSCESLMLDSISRSDTIPVNTLETNDVIFSHEAKIGKISDKAIYYLMTRGMSEEEATELIVRGFAEPIAKSFPVEYAVEMNRLIDLELEGTIG